MSFSSLIKEELIKIRPKKAEVRLATLSALTHMIGSLSLGLGSKRISFVTENSNVAKYITILAASIYRVECETLVLQQQKLNKNQSFVVRVSGTEVDKMLAETGVLIASEDGVSVGRTILPNLIRSNTMRRAFLRGAFLGGGFISDPKKNYHLELVVRDEEFARDLCMLLNSYDLNAKTMIRSGNYVIYLKESERIMSFLALTGANAAILELENIRIVKDIRNNLNRAVNCESANMDKTVNAALHQINNIKTIQREVGLDKLPVQLLEIAELRLNNPDATLRELAEMLGIGRSGVSHRLRRLEDMALQIRIQKGEA